MADAIDADVDFATAALERVNIAEDELNVVLPQLMAAEEDLHKLTVEHVAEVARQVSNPSDHAKLAIEALCVLRDVEMATGAAKLCSDSPKLYADLMSMDKDHISADKVAKLESIATRDDFKPDEFQGEGLQAVSRWVRGVFLYFNLAQLVEAQHKRLEEALQAAEDVTSALGAASAGAGIPAA